MTSHLFQLISYARRLFHKHSWSFQPWAICLSNIRESDMTKRETGKLCSCNLYCIQNIQILKDHIFFLGGGGARGKLFCFFKVLMHFRLNWKLEVLVYEGPEAGGRDEGTRAQEKKPLGERTRNNSAGLEQRPSRAEGKGSHITAPPC